VTNNIARGRGIGNPPDLPDLKGKRNNEGGRGEGSTNDFSTWRPIIPDMQGETGGISHPFPVILSEILFGILRHETNVDALHSARCGSNDR